MRYTDKLESERLITRFVTPDDVAAWAAFFRNEKTTEFHANPDNLSPKQRAQHWIEFTMGRYNSNRLGMQALIHKSTGEFIGQCGLLLQEIDGKQVVEIGYHLLIQHWHKGYAAEAARMFRDYGFENNFADTLVSIIHPLNNNSKKVADRNGMKLVAADALFHGELYNLFAITRQEWQALLPGIQPAKD